MDTNAPSRLLTLEDVDEAADVIAQAFVDDPLCAYMLPNRRTRVSALRKFFRAYCRVGIKGGRGYGVGDPLQGVAFWKSPDQEDLSISVKSLGGFLPILFTSYPIGYVRAREILRQQEALHARFADQPHYYLDNLGVLESARGQGVASRLIRPILDTADSRRVLVYTDTVTESNVALYEHFGFVCVEACSVEGTGITIWALRRPPATA